MSYFQVSHLSKRYGKSAAFDDISFSLAQGELVSLLGPGGCGKSTLLRCIAGLADADSGQILIGGKALGGVIPAKRGVSLVCQADALFPNLTVAGNVAYGLKMHSVSVAETAQRIAEVLRLTGLEGREHTLVQQLSGGQKLRVALARALVVRPRVLLLDAPLSALDARVRKHLQEEIRRIQSALQLTTVFVTHDQEEALMLSDRIFIMDGGRIVQEGSADMIYTRPANGFVAGFMGSYNLLDAGQAERLLGLTIKGLLAIRPEAIEVGEAGRSYGDHLSAPCAATVRHHQLLGNVIRYHVDAQGCTLMVDRLNRSAASMLAAGAQIELRFHRDELREVAN